MLKFELGVEQKQRNLKTPRDKISSDNGCQSQR